MFPMTPVKGRDEASWIAHRIMSPMGWGSCEPPELPDEALAVKAGETGEAIGLRPMVVH